MSFNCGNDKQMVEKNGQGLFWCYDECHFTTPLTLPCLPLGLGFFKLTVIL